MPQGFRYIYLLRLVPMVLTLVSGCATSGNNDSVQSKVDAMSACEKIDRLVAAYDDEFKPIRARNTSQRFMMIWDAKVNAVGDNCEVWQTGAGKTSYVCTRIAPNEGVAKQWYDSDIGNINACLNEWIREDLPRPRIKDPQIS